MYSKRNFRAKDFNTFLKHALNTIFPLMWFYFTKSHNTIYIYCKKKCHRNAYQAFIRGDVISL